ncbi:MAG: formylglycine-generating enzyme family protein [Gemmatimonadota bacterium]|nr:formylglycine-generating enzyme family protein [Gemmatimonadota bacterium]
MFRALLILSLTLPACSRVPESLTVELAPGVAMEFAYIPPGTFAMGAAPGEEGPLDDSETPQHQVELSRGFYLAKYELTQAQWRAVVGTQPWRRRQYVKEGAQHPATYISWIEAEHFIQRLNKKAGKTLYRFPTEAEWEYTCRAGTTTRWFSGDDEQTLVDYAWVSSNSWAVGEKYPHPVGQKAPNAWGLYDMHGNVWEWVADWEGPYDSEKKIDPQGPATGERRVGRGGSFGTLGLGGRSASRFFSPPDARSPDVGVRIAREVTTDQ